MQGKLLVIGTPIGNLEDLSSRAGEAISSCEVLVCEDSRVASKLVNHVLKENQADKKPRYFVLNDFNEREKYMEVVGMVEEGLTVGLVSDAGMPIISDPGFRVVRACYQRKLQVVVIPGPSAVTSAVSSSGLGGEKFIFGGFLPKKPGKRKNELEKYRQAMEIFPDLRVVVFATPHRLEKDLTDLYEVFGNAIRVVIMREMTKKFEERLEGNTSEVLDAIRGRKQRGEIVLVFARESE